jgi:type I restriction enzyme S subunit
MAREMKNSGVQWIGDIPSNWNVHPLGLFFSERVHLNSMNLESNLLSLSYGKIIKKNINTVGGLLPASYAGYNIIEADDIVIRPTDLQNDKKSLRTGLAKEHGIVTSAYIALKPSNSIYSPYFHYLLHSYDVAKVFYNMGNGVRQGLNYSELKKLLLIEPPLADQKSIADFLDAKCADIDGLLADMDQEVKTLADYKKSLIAETVTHGLNPSAPMKQSGIPWLSDVPAHWDIHPVYTYFDQRIHKNIFGTEQNLLSLSYGRIITKDIDILGGLLPASFNTYNIVEEGDIIIRPTDLQNDKRSLRTGLVREHGMITSAYIALKPKNNQNSAYFHYLLHTYDVMKVFYNMGNGVRQGLNYSEFSRLMLVAPPQEEQIAIANYLDEKCKVIDESIADKQDQIEKLKAYKASLIYEYVTGKKLVAL